MIRERVFVSEKLIQKVKNHKTPTFKIAVNCAVNPASLSRIINKIETVKKGDPRILRLAEHLGLSPEDCFECEQTCSVKG